MVPSGPSENVSGHRSPLILYEGGDAVRLTDLYCILLDRAQIEPPPLVDPKTIRWLGLGDTLYLSSEVFLERRGLFRTSVVMR